MNMNMNMNILGSIVSFADDLSISYEAESWEQLKLKAEKDLQSISDWLNYNKLTLNMEKSCYLPFTSYENGLPNIGPIKARNGTTILESRDGFVKYLGITVDRHMRWEYHCEQLAKKLRGLLHRFKRLKKQLNLKYLRMVYFGLVQSLLIYGISGWGAAYDVHIERLNIVQKCILKIICGHRMLFPSDEIYRVAHVLDLRQLYFMKIAALIKRRKIELRPIDHNYSTRHKLDHYKESKTTKTIGQRSCTYLAPKIYGTIPITLRALRNPVRFKKEVIRWLLGLNRKTIHNVINNRI